MKIYKKPKIYIVAGEPSGDILGDQLIKSLQTKFDSPIFNGVGGEKMQSNNFRSLPEFQEWSFNSDFIFFIINIFMPPN